MSDTQGNPGTPETEKTADTPTGASESPVSEDREAAQQDEQQQDRTDWKAMALGFKATLEERNRREEELRQQAQVAYTSPTVDPRMAQTQADMVRLQQAYMAEQQAAAAGDERAFLMMKLIEDQMQTKTELMHQMQLGRIADPERREKVWDLFQKNRDKFNTLDAAEVYLDGLTYREQRQALAAKEKEASAVLQAKQAGVVGTHGSREVSASEAKVRKMSEAQFDNEVDRLRSEGKDDEARNLMNLVRQRKVVLTG